MSKFSRRQINDTFFSIFFSRSYALTFHANCPLRRQFAWNVKAYYLEKNKEKKYFKMSSAVIITQHAKLLMATPRSTKVKLFIALQ